MPSQPPTSAFQPPKSSVPFAHDPTMQALWTRYGTELEPLFPAADPFVQLLRSVVGQQLSVGAARSIWARLEAWGQSAGDGDGGGGLSAETLLRASGDDLRALGLSWAKVRSLQDIARAKTEGTVDFSALHQLSDEEVVAALLPLRGVGRWTAEMFLMFALARPDVFSVGDLALRKGLARHYPEADPAKVVTGWSPHRTLAARLLWADQNTAPDL